MQIFSLRERKEKKAHHESVNEDIVFVVRRLNMRMFVCHKRKKAGEKREIVDCQQGKVPHGNHQHTSVTFFFSGR
jgi:hypothetical protein